MNRSIIRALMALLVLIGGAAYVLSLWKPGFSFPILMGGNVLMFFISLGTFFIVGKNFKGRPEAFVRGVMASTMLKLFACIIAVTIYVMIYRQQLYKPQLFALLGIYALYLIVETKLLSQMAKVNS